MTNLIIKDFLTIKKHLPIVIIVAIMLPLILAYSKINNSFLTILLTVLYLEFFTLMYICAKDYQCPKAAALIASTPYSRDLIVASRYMLIVILFLISLLLVIMETLLVPLLSAITLIDMSSVFLIISAILGIFMPFIYKFGYEKTRYLYMLLILCTPVLTNLFKPAITERVLNTLYRFRISLSILFFIAGIAILYTSFLISKAVYRKKEL